jgi:hypothetical protein
VFLEGIYEKVSVFYVAATIFGIHGNFPDFCRILLRTCASFWHERKCLPDHVAEMSWCAADICIQLHYHYSILVLYR